MGLISTIISAVVTIIAGSIVKVIADDAKEWTPWITRRLLDIAVRRLPEGQRERYAEEWAAHLAEVPGVVGKLAVSLQFQIAVFGAREVDAKARLDAWQDELDAAVAASLALGIAGAEAQEPSDAAKKAILQVWEAVGERPALGITVTGAIFLSRRFIVNAMRFSNRRCGTRFRWEALTPWG